MWKLHHGTHLSLTIVNRNRVCLTIGDGLSALNTPARGQLYINSVILYAYDAADVMEDNNYATVLDSCVTTSFLLVAPVSTKKVSKLDHLVLIKRLGRLSTGLKIN